MTIVQDHIKEKVRRDPKRDEESRLKKRKRLNFNTLLSVDAFQLEIYCTAKLMYLFKFPANSLTFSKLYELFRAALKTEYVLNQTTTTGFSLPLSAGSSTLAHLVNRAINQSEITWAQRPHIKPIHNPLAYNFNLKARRIAMGMPIR